MLVVVGIMIALGINNQNEDRKTKYFEYEISKDIEASMAGNFWQMDMGINCGKSCIYSSDIILSHLEENLPYHDSLDIHFSKSLEWCSPVLNNPGYESLKTIVEIL